AAPSGVSVIEAITGAFDPQLSTVIVCWRGSLTTKLFPTTSCTTYLPATSATKVGLVEWASLRAALLPEGRETMDQSKLSWRPCGSLLAVPSSCTVVPMFTSAGAVAFAVGCCTDLGQPNSAAVRISATRCRKLSCMACTPF